MDDTYLVAPPEVIFPHAIPAHENNLRELGLNFQPLKSACYINSTFCTNSFHNLRSSIPEQQLTLDDRSITRGLTIYGAPLGDTAFIKQYLQNHKVTLDCDFVAISDLLCPGQFDQATIPVREWLLLVTHRRVPAESIKLPLSSRWTTLDSRLRSCH
jgi:hypothetical protein